LQGAICERRLACIGLRRLIVASLAIATLCSGCATGVTGGSRFVLPDLAVVEGQVISDVGGTVEYWAEFGLTSAYGSVSSHQTVFTNPNSLTGVSATLLNLQRSTRYHYRFCAQDSQQRGGPACGADATLKTQSAGCGETVTTDVRLTGNLGCPNSSGFVIGADGLEIDLAGYTMRGPLTPNLGGRAAIDNSAGHDDLTVHDGDLSEWATAVRTRGASRNRILRVQGSAFGPVIDIAGGEDNEVRHGAFFGRSDGIVVTDSPGLVVADSRLTLPGGDGLLVKADRGRIVRNAVVHDTLAPEVASGIQLIGSNFRIAYNRVGDGWSNGAILVSGSANAVVGNDVFGSQGSGIVVGAFSSGTLLNANLAHDNTGDGIEVRAPATRLRGNRADDNGDFGIDAVAGVTDLGGNTASGNGNPLQCRNVFCQ
jgi:hypothetical protein